MRRGESSTATLMPESRSGPPHRENVATLRQAPDPLPSVVFQHEPLGLRMPVPGKRWPVLGLISLVLAVTLYLFPSALVVVALAVRRLDFDILILNLFQWAIPLIVICPVVGVWLGFLAVLRYRKAFDTVASAIERRGFGVQHSQLDIGIRAVVEAVVTRQETTRGIECTGSVCF